MSSAMLYSDVDINSKEYAIQSVLGRYLDSDQVIDAMALWKNNYKHQPQATLSMFITDVCERYDLKFKRTQITGAIFLELSESSIPQRIETSLRKSEHIEKQQTKSTPIISTTVPTYIESFAILTTVLELRIEGTKRETIQLLTAISKREVPTPTIETLIKYCQYTTLSSLPKISPEQAVQLESLNLEFIRQLTNNLYILLCEKLGPVKADQTLQQAIKHVEQSFSALNVRQIL